MVRMIVLEGSDECCICVSVDSTSTRLAPLSSAPETRAMLGHTIERSCQLLSFTQPVLRIMLSEVSRTVLPTCAQRLQCLKLGLNCVVEKVLQHHHIDIELILGIRTPCICHSEAANKRWQSRLITEFMVLFDGRAVGLQAGLPTRRDAYRLTSATQRQELIDLARRSMTTIQHVPGGKQTVRATPTSLGFGGRRRNIGPRQVGSLLLQSYFNTYCRIVIQGGIKWST